MEAEDLVYGGFLKAYGAWKKANGQVADEERLSLRCISRTGACRFAATFK